MKAEPKNKITLDVRMALNDLKDTMLSMSPDISCHSCKEAFCCINQKIIEISDVEFDIRKKFITKEQAKRAEEAIKTKKSTGLYTCPFNNPDTGECEIYTARFAVCASYGVVNPKEHCNSDTKHGLMVVNPMNIFSKIKNENTLNYLAMASQGEPVDLLDEFESWLKSI